MANRKDNNGRVLRTGESQRKSDGRYQFDYTDYTGRRKRIYADTLPELRQREKQIDRDMQDGIDFIRSNMSLNQLFEIYMETKTNLRDSTRCNYINLWDYTVKDSTIGNMPINRIKQIHIRTFYTDLAKRGLTESTIKLYQNMIYPALEMAVDSDMIRKNPAKGANKGIGEAPEKREALTRAEQNALMDYLEQDNIYSIYHPIITFMLSTALRVGEVAGLRWSDVDLKNNVIHIRQQLIYKNMGDGCKFHVSNLKTDAGRRDIPLTAVAKDALLQQRELYRLTGKAFTQQEVDGISDFVFTNKNGTPYAANAVNCFLKNIVSAYNKQETRIAEEENREAVLLPHVSAHILRHTGCTRMAESGLDPKVLQSIMGHSSISVTMDVYTHLDFSQIQEKMNEVQIKIG